MKYGKLIDSIVFYATNIIRLNDSYVIDPTAEQILEAGYLPVVDEPPEVDAHHHCEAVGWDQLDNEIRRRYEIVENPPRVFSKLKIALVLKSMGLWDAVKQYIENAGIYDLYLAAQDFAEDNEFFTAGKAKLQETLGLDDDAVEQILAASIKDG